MSVFARVLSLGSLPLSCISFSGSPRTMPLLQAALSPAAPHFGVRAAWVLERRGVSWPFSQKLQKTLIPDQLRVRATDQCSGVRETGISRTRKQPSGLLPSAGPRWVSILARFSRPKACGLRRLNASWLDRPLTFPFAPPCSIMIQPHLTAPRIPVCLCTIACGEAVQGTKQAVLSTTCAEGAEAIFPEAHTIAFFNTHLRNVCTAFRFLDYWSLTPRSLDPFNDDVLEECTCLGGKQYIAYMVQPGLGAPVGTTLQQVQECQDE